ncbi:hypothetical protein LguiA_010766 [Lonicera macranthoides]
MRYITISRKKIINAAKTEYEIKGRERGGFKCSFNDKLTNRLCEREGSNQGHSIKEQEKKKSLGQMKWAVGSLRL